MKNILITGSSQGLGADMAKMLAEDGVRIFVNCAHCVVKAQVVVEEIVASGGKAEVLQGDVSNPEIVEDMFGKLESYGGVEVLINNARVDPYKRSAEMNDADWFDRVIGVNLKGPYLCSLAAIEQMNKKGFGRIINVSSVWAYRSADRTMMEYAMSKAAMHSLTRSLAGIAGPSGITVNTVAPGLIMTDELEKRWSEEKLNNIYANIPVRRGAVTDEVVAAVKFVIDNAYLNGETININGGVYMP
jgi:NAD(P)-dependent dehydrogenase (short-subunit alcohol dehydrogenase family)